MKHEFKGVVSTRRFGPRGASTYCHYGLRIKQDSLLNEITEEYDLEEVKANGKRGPGGGSILAKLGIRIPKKVAEPIYPFPVT